MRDARAICLILCLLIPVAGLSTLSGCGGCRSDAEKSEAEKRKKKAEELAKKKKKKPDFKFGQPIALPNDRRLPLCFYKPGHWTSTALAAKANNFNFLGDLEVALIDTNGKPIALEGVPYYLSESREAALPKGQPKFLRSALFVPAVGQRAYGSFRLTARRSGHQVFRTRHPLSRMPSYQYHLAVLSRSPEKYLYLERLPSVRPASDTLGLGEQTVFYRVSLLKVGRQVLLPSESLFWTSIACVVWDDIPPGSLSPEQQEALVDWLHWGGRLIISGPGTLDSLRDSFLADYLPATSEGVWELTEADFEPLGRFVQPTSGRPIPKLAPAARWTGVKLKLRDGARAVPGAGKLLAERRVGRGRIVVSAVRLSDLPLVNWQGFDVMFNACLLGRPPRRYRVGTEGEVELCWASRSMRRLDAALTCNLRYFTRDTGVRYANYAGDVLKAEAEWTDSADPFLFAQTGTAGQSPTSAGQGVAAWSSFNPVACKAREALQKAARIEIPGRMFVVWVLAVYLVVLVPTNWLAFQALGRVEWAWVAAPLISIACTMAVIRLARLDIGFARSTTELAVVELQGEYPRAHVTRFTALYTSLATQYDFRHEDPGALVQPFPIVGTLAQFRLLPSQGRDTLHYRHGKDVSLAGYRVSSNTTGLVHSEQMLAFDGPLSLARNSRGRLQINNQTGLPLYGIGVMQRTAEGKLRTAWVGRLPEIGSAELSFHRAEEKKDAGRWWLDQRNQEPVTTTSPGPGEFNLRELFDIAQDAKGLRPGEFRLIGWSDTSIPGLHIRPASPQARHAMLVVAHLRQGNGPDPKPDVNTLADVAGARQTSD